MVTPPKKIGEYVGTIHIYLLRIYLFEASLWVCSLIIDKSQIILKTIIIMVITYIYIYNDSLRMIPLIIKQSLVVGCEAAEWGLALHDQPVGYWRRGQPGGAVLYNLYEGGFWEWSLGWCMKLLKLISMTIQWESENVLKSKICLCYCWSDQQHKDTERLHIWHWKTR